MKDENYLHEWEDEIILPYVWVVTAHAADNNPIIGVYSNEEKAREIYMQWTQTSWTQTQWLFL